MRDACLQAKYFAPETSCPATDTAASSDPTKIVYSPQESVHTDASCLCAGQVCHANGTLAVMDTTALHPTCYFPYRQLAAFKSLASLALDYCLPNSQVTSHSCLLVSAC